MHQNKSRMLDIKKKEKEESPGTLFVYREEVSSTFWARAYLSCSIFLSGCECILMKPILY